MTWILGIGRLGRSGPFLALATLALVSACSTDVEYLRAGNVPAGAGGGGGSAGAGGNAGASGSSSDDAGAEAAPDADDGATAEDMGTGDAPDAGAHDAEPPRPTGIILGLPTASDLLAPSPGGMNYTDLCMPSGAVIGVRGTVDPPGSTTPWLKSFALICGTLSVTADPPYKVTTTSTGVQTTRGDHPASVVQDKLCSANEVVVGFESRASFYVDALNVRCAPLDLTQGPQGYALSIGTSKPIGDIGGTSGTTQRSISCPNGSIAVGSILRAGDALDAFGFGCAVPTLQFAPSSTRRE